MNLANSTPERPMRALVCGASGFIGAALVRRLVGRGADVVALSRSRGRLDPNSTSYRFVACDLCDAEQTRRAIDLSKPQVVFYLAGHPDRKEDGAQVNLVIQNNIVALANLLDALTSLPTVALVYGDSAKVYGNGAVPFRSKQALDPLSSYSVSKETGWRLIDMYRRVHGLQAVGLRPTLVYGAEQSFNLFSHIINAIHSDREDITLDGGGQTRDPLYIDDVIDAFIRAAERVRLLSGMTIPMGGGDERTVEDIARTAVRVLGGRQKVTVCASSVRPTETMRSWCDNAEAFELLGWRPCVELEEGIRRTAGASVMGTRLPTSPITASQGT